MKINALSWLVETIFFVTLHKEKFRLVSMKGHENAIRAMMQIRGMEEGNRYYDPRSPIPLVYVRPELVDKETDEYKFSAMIRHAKDEMREKYHPILRNKLFDTAQEAADYILAIAEKENGGK